MPLKKFMTDHVTKYQAALLEGLVDDWQALKDWDINSDEGIVYLSDAFGQDFLLERTDVGNYLYSPDRKNAKIEYSTFQETMDKMNHR